MIPLKIKVAIASLVLVIAQLQVFFVHQQTEITSLTKELSEYKVKLQTEERRSEQLGSSVEQLKKVIEDNNTRIEQAQQLSERLKAQAQIQQQQAQSNAKEYQKQIDFLRNKKLEGSECEQIIGLLDSLD